MIHLTYFKTLNISSTMQFIMEIKSFNCQVIRAKTFNQDGSGFISDRIWFGDMAEKLRTRNDLWEKLDDPNPSLHPNSRDTSMTLLIIRYDSGWNGKIIKNCLCIQSLCSNNKFLLRYIQILPFPFWYSNVFDIQIDRYGLLVFRIFTLKTPASLIGNYNR